MPPGAKLIAVGVFSPFFVPIKVLAMAALLLSLPWWMYQVWAFVAPGLYKNERSAFLPFLFATPILFFTGAALVYFGLMPVAITF